jgi:hypothetical protein
VFTRMLTQMYRLLQRFVRVGTAIQADQHAREHGGSGGSGFWD